MITFSFYGRVLVDTDGRNQSRFIMRSKQASKYIEKQRLEEEEEQEEEEEEKKEHQPILTF